MADVETSTEEPDPLSHHANCVDLGKPRRASRWEETPLALFIAPIFTLVPAAATAPALITVGMFMMEPIMDIDFRDYTEAIPAFLTIAMMPFAYSIAEGIFFGMISYTLLKTVSGKTKEVSPLMWVLSILFVLRYIFIV